MDHNFKEVYMHGHGCGVSAGAYYTILFWSGIIGFYVFAYSDKLIPSLAKWERRAAFGFWFFYFCARYSW